MHNKIILLILFSAVVFNMSFSQQPYILNGTIDSIFNDRKIFLYKIDYSNTYAGKLDSAIVENGKFKIKGSLNTPAVLVSLYLENQRDIFQFILREGSTQIEILPGYSETNGERYSNVSGSKLKTNTDYNDIYKHWKIISQLYDNESIPYYIKRNDASTTNMQLAKLINDTINIIEKKTLPHKVHLIRENAHNYMGLYLLSYFVFDEIQKTPDTIINLYNLLSPSLKEMPEGKTLLERIKAVKQVKVGSRAPDFEAINIHNKKIKLSDYKGKKVLLEFWASWCGPCIEKIPGLLRYHQSYPDIAVIAISIDNNKKSWKKAITKHGLDWAENISDLNGWDNKIALKYNVTEIPKNILINEQGEIIEIDVNF